MNKAAVVAVAVLLVILVGCQIRSCRQTGAVMVPPKGVEHVYQCQADKSEYKLSPGQICRRIRMDDPDQTMQSASRAMKARISAVFRAAAIMMNMVRKQPNATMFMKM